MKPVRQQIARSLARGLPGAAAQRLFEPELAYGRHAGPAAVDARQAAVLVLVYFQGGTWFVPVTVRTPGMREHAGQIALPGGAVEAEETPRQAALREFKEELGVSRDELLHALADRYAEFRRQHLKAERERLSRLH